MVAALVRRFREVIAVSIVGDSVTPDNFYPYRSWVYVTNLVYLLSALAAQEVVNRVAKTEADAVQSFQAVTCH
ncbi:hypothetical protein [Mesorhizobium sp. B2-3-13]|uniref:hypothetical protein n=1 Tax=Mesorhizobium sp. B2-3-13 TaxID=2589951 RepID=UPI0015E2DA88|nr:hypothetical protein [Mesorhizobium sp. B2-3-13]